MRPAPPLVEEVEPQEAVRRRGIGDQPERGVGRRPLGALRADGGLQEVRLVTQDQVERRVGIAVKRQTRAGSPAALGLAESAARMRN